MRTLCKICFLVGLLAAGQKACLARLDAPYDNPPYDSDIAGASASRNSGGFFPRVSMGWTELKYWIGTDITAGSVIMDFALPFLDGPGSDLAVLTGGECWGHLADQAEFKFYNAGAPQGSFTASLAADTLFEFELPGAGIVADRIVITNITPDPPGVNDDATMEFVDAGVRTLIPEPASAGLLLLGLPLLMRRRSKFRRAAKRAAGIVGPAAKFARLGPSNLRKTAGHSTGTPAAGPPMDTRMQADIHTNATPQDRGEKRAAGTRPARPHLSSVSTHLFASQRAGGDGHVAGMAADSEGPQGRRCLQAFPDTQRTNQTHRARPVRPYLPSMSAYLLTCRRVGGAGHVAGMATDPEGPQGRRCLQAFPETQRTNQTGGSRPARPYLPSMTACSLSAGACPPLGGRPGRRGQAGPGTCNRCPDGTGYVEVHGKEDRKKGTDKWNTGTDRTFARVSSG